jgi:hypothetical protein
MGQFQTQPPAWVLGENFSLNSLSNFSKMLQEIQKIAAENTTTEYAAAQANGEAAYQVDLKQSEATRYDADTQFVMGGFTLAGEMSGFIAGKVKFDKQIAKVDSELNVYKGWQDELDGKATTQRLLANEDIEMKTLSKISREDLNSLKDSLKKGEPTTELLDKLNQAKSSDPELVQELKDTAAKKIKEFEKKLSSLHQEKHSYLEKVNRISQSFGNIGTGATKLLQANAYQEQGEARRIQALATYCSDATKAIQSQLIGLRDALNGQMNSIADGMISKVAESNKI